MKPAMEDWIRQWFADNLDALRRESGHRLAPAVEQAALQQRQNSWGARLFRAAVTVAGAVGGAAGGAVAAAAANQAADLIFPD